MFRSFAALALVLVSTLLPAGVSAAQAQTLRVAVASNFQGVVKELAARFQQETGNKVTVSYGSTGTLYNQITHGAPFDVFLSADQRRPALLAKNNLTDGEPQPYAYGRLVFWQPGNPQPTYESIKGWSGRLAIANPKTAPYGLAAEQVMESMGVWRQKQSQLVRGANILQAWQFVSTGSAKAGFVALSQLKSDKVKNGYLVIDKNLYQPIRQDAVVLAHSRHKAVAHQFVDFLRAKEQQQKIEDLGYFPVTTAFSSAQE